MTGLWIGQWVQLIVDLAVLLAIFAVIAYFVFGGKVSVSVRGGRFRFYLMVKGPGKISGTHRSKGHYQVKKDDNNRSD